MSVEIRCLSLHQPWASLMAIGAKHVETRSWSTPYRGWLAIHAAKTRDSLDWGWHNIEPFRTVLTRAGHPTVSNGVSEWPDDSAFPFGAIVAIGNLHKVGRIYERNGASYVSGQELPYEGDELAFGDWTPGRYGWVVTGVGRLREPIPLRGQQGLWRLDGEVAEQLEGLIR